MTALLPSGARLELFETLDSTSLEAKRRQIAGERGPLWVVARRQTAGYGRRGAEWRQQEGDVAATLLFTEAAAIGALSQLSFVAALAVSDAVLHFAPAAPIALKWPNDILAGGAKLSGLILELLNAEAGAAQIALGVGVNIVAAPQGLAYRTARLADLTPALIPPLDFVRVLDERFDARRRHWREGGFAPIRKAWLERAYGLGRLARVEEAGESVSGLFIGVDETGALLIDEDGVIRTLTTGRLQIGDE